MRTQSDAQENSAAPMSLNAPAAVPSSRMPWRIAQAEALDGYSFHVRFSNGLEGTVDMAHLIASKNAGVFAALADLARFRQIRVENGAVVWPSELDLAPDAMYRAIAASGRWIL